MAEDKKTESIWSVELGTYVLRHSAETMLAKASKKLPQELSAVQQKVVPVPRPKQKTIYSARLTGFDKTSAKKICHVLGAAYHCRSIAP